MQSQTPGPLMMGPTTTSIAAVTDKQLDVTFGSDEQELINSEHQLNHYPSYIENHNVGGGLLLDSQSAGGSSDGKNGQLAPIGIKKSGKPGRNEANILRNNRSSPVQEEAVEEEAEIDSTGDSINDFEKAKQRLADLEKRYNTITFKQKKQLQKKAMKEKYTNFNYNATTQDWNKPLVMPKSITSFEEGETQFNFKAPQKYQSPKNNNNGTSKSRVSVFTSAQKMRTASEGIQTATVGGAGRQESFGKTAGPEGFRTVSKLVDIKNDNSNLPRTNSTQMANLRGVALQTPPIPSGGKYSPAAGLLGKTHQFATLEQAKKFRQRSLLEAATKDGLKQNNNSISELNAESLDVGTFTSPMHGVLFKGVTGSATTKNLLPLPRSLTAAGNNNNTWAEDQRLKKFLKEFEQVEYTFLDTNIEDPLQKIKKQMTFLLEKGVKFMAPTVAPEVVEIFDRSLNNILYFNEKRLNYFRNELKFYAMEREKHVAMIEERDALIAVYKERDMSEEEKRKMAWKHRQIRNDKHQKFDESIEELFTQDALAVKKFEQPYIISQPEEERDREDEERTMNFRRMNWLEKDMELMMRLISMDVNETVKQQAQMNVDGMLNTLGEHLKEGVGLGIQNQISNFHLRIEEILKENQKLLKAKAPEKIDRCYQTETWNMERYLDELESLKRQKWILDKENRDNREKLESNKERIKRLKDDLARFIKKVQTMENKEKMIDNIMQDKDKQMAELKQEHHIAAGQWVKKDIEKTKEIRALNERYEMLNLAKITREVDLMKREEEMNKKLEAMNEKLNQQKQAMAYFQKLLNKKTSELESTKDLLEMQLQFQAVLEDEDSEGFDTGKSKGKKKKKVAISVGADDLALNSKRGQTGRNAGQDLPSNKNTVSSFAKTSPKNDDSISSSNHHETGKNPPMVIQNEDFLSVPEKRSPKFVPKKTEDAIIPITSPHVDKPILKKDQLEPIQEIFTPSPSKTPQFTAKKSQEYENKQEPVVPLQLTNEGEQNMPLRVQTPEPINDEGQKTPDNKKDISGRQSTDSLPRTDTFNPFQTTQVEEVKDEEIQRNQSLKKSTLLKSLIDLASQKISKSETRQHQLNDDRLLITTEDIGIQVELQKSSSKELAQVIQRPSFRLMLPLNKPAGVTIATQTNDYQESIAKPKPLKLGEEPPRKQSPFQGQRIKGPVRAQPTQPSITASGQLAPSQKKSVLSEDKSSQKTNPNMKSIAQASDDFMDSLQKSLDLLKNHESFKDKPPSRAKSPPQKPPSRVEGLQRRTILEEDDNLIKGKTVVFSSGNSRAQSPEETKKTHASPPVKKPAKPEKTIDFAASNIKGKKQISPPPPVNQTQEPPKEVKTDSKAQIQNIKPNSQQTQKSEGVKNPPQQMKKEEELKSPKPKTEGEPQKTETEIKPTALKKGIESALNSLAQVSKHAKYARNAAGILENMLSLKNKESVGATNVEEQKQPTSVEDAQKKKKKSQRTERQQQQQMQQKITSNENREEEKKQSKDDSLEINTVGDRERSRSRPRREYMEIDERTSQELAIMEYYMNMKPEKPFNAVVVGHRASIQQIMFSPEKSRSRSSSPHRHSMSKNETGYDYYTEDQVQIVDDQLQLQKKKTTVLMKKDGRETLNSPSAVLHPNPNSTYPPPAQQK